MTPLQKKLLEIVEDIDRAGEWSPLYREDFVKQIEDAVGEDAAGLEQ